MIRRLPWLALLALVLAALGTPPAAAAPPEKWHATSKGFNAYAGWYECEVDSTCVDGYIYVAQATKTRTVANSQCAPPNSCAWDSTSG